MTLSDQNVVPINVAVGNHASHRGIGEILYTLHTFLVRLSDRYELTFSFDLVPGKINVLIDEFSVPGTVAYLQKFKSNNPGTKLVVVATEFVTAINLFGARLGETFNYFDHWEDRPYGAAMIAYWLGLKRTAPYMRSRYLGFVEVLQLADLVVAVHPAIVAALTPLVPKMKHWVADPVNLYPEIDPKRTALDSRLKEWPAGFVLTGTLTHFRKQIIKRLLRSSRLAEIQGSVFLHLPFDRTGGFNVHDGSIDFPFDKPIPGIGKETKIERHSDNASSALGCLYNLNPPQRANWPYSSPMRILRAILYGQIPVVTRRFGDHEIEAVTRLWNPETADIGELSELWLEATLDRDELIERHIAAISEYNKVAESRNVAADLALRALSSPS